MGISFLLFWTSVFDLLLGATVNIVAMVTAAKEAKTYHVIEVYGAVKQDLLQKNLRVLLLLGMEI